MVKIYENMIHESPVLMKYFHQLTVRWWNQEEFVPVGIKQNPGMQAQEKNKFKHLQKKKVHGSILHFNSWNHETLTVILYHNPLKIWDLIPVSCTE